MKTKDMILTSMIGALTAIGAWISIPLAASAVPITLQMFFTLLAGILLGARLGALSQLVYIAIGAIGIPVFAGGKAGLPVLIGPTGGYLLGFVLAAYIVGKLTEKQKELKPARTLLSMILGTIVIYSLGALQLAWVADLSYSKAITVGVVPFLFPDVFKIIGATVLGISVKRALVRADLIKA